MVRFRATERVGALTLYGRDRAIALVREFMLRQEDERHRLHSRRVPVLVFTGPRGIGKTALLTELAERMDQKVPHARLDLERRPRDGVAGVLSDLVFGLNRRCGSRYRRLAFPRFITGQLVVQETLPTDRPAALQAVRQALRKRRAQPLGRIASEVVSDVLSRIPVVRNLPGIRTLPKDLAGYLVDGLASWRRSRRLILGAGQAWYGHQDRDRQNDSLDVLVDLNRDAKNPAQRQAVEELLWTAFLADLRDNFLHGRRAYEWSMNAVVLVDNVHSPAGEEFLRRLASATEPAGDDVAPLTVVAAQLGALDDQIDVEGASYSDWKARSADGQRRDRYAVALNNLSQGDVGQLLAAQGLPDSKRSTVTHGQLSTLVHQFTGGHPGATWALATEIQQQPDDPANLNAAVARVENELLETFLHGLSASVRYDLASCAIASDRDQAGRLSTNARLMIGRAHGAAVLSRTLWVDGPAADSAELPVVLRRLLLRQVAIRPAGDKATWDALYTWSTEDLHAIGDLERALRHELALGKVKEVTDALVRRHAELGVHEWLRLLESTAAAPHRASPPADPGGQVDALTKWADPADRFVTPLARLLVALWLVESPLTGNARRELYEHVADNYDELRPPGGKGRVACVDRSNEYRERAAEWV